MRRTWCLYCATSTDPSSLARGTSPEHRSSLLARALYGYFVALSARSVISCSGGASCGIALPRLARPSAACLRIAGGVGGYAKRCIASDASSTHSKHTRCQARSKHAWSAVHATAARKPGASRAPKSTAPADAGASRVPAWLAISACATSLRVWAYQATLSSSSNSTIVARTSAGAMRSCESSHVGHAEGGLSHGRRLGIEKGEPRTLIAANGYMAKAWHNQDSSHQDFTIFHARDPPDQRECARSPEASGVLRTARGPSVSIIAAPALSRGGLNKLVNWPGTTDAEAGDCHRN